MCIRDSNIPEDEHVDFVRGCRKLHKMLLRYLGSFQAWLYDCNAEGLDYHFPLKEDGEQEVLVQPSLPVMVGNGPLCELVLEDELDVFLEPWHVAGHSLVEYPM
eukprot:6051125-Pyramimonas_sp.AAC.1